MAVTINGNVMSMSANADSSDSAFGTGAPIHVNAIHIVTTGASGPTIMRQGGASGPTILSLTPATSDTTIISFSKPQRFTSLYLDTLGANALIRVFFV